VAVERRKTVENSLKLLIYKRFSVLQKRVELALEDR